MTYCLEGSCSIQLSYRTFGCANIVESNNFQPTDVLDLFWEVYKKILSNKKRGSYTTFKKGLIVAVVEKNPHYLAGIFQMLFLSYAWAGVTVFNNLLQNFFTEEILAVSFLLIEMTPPRSLLNCCRKSASIDLGQ